MKNIIKKICICGASLMMISSIGAGISNVSARRVPHSRFSVNTPRIDYHHRARRHHLYRYHRNRTPNLATYDNYGRYEVKITKPTKLIYEKRSFSGRSRVLRSRWIHRGTYLRLSGHNSVYDGPVYVAYGRHSFGNHGNKLSIITLNHHNYKFIRKI